MLADLERQVGEAKVNLKQNYTPYKIKDRHTA